MFYPDRQHYKRTKNIGVRNVKGPIHRIIFMKKRNYFHEKNISCREKKIFLVMKIIRSKQRTI